MSTTTTTPTLPAPRGEARPATWINRPKHRKPVPDEHVTYIDDLLLRLGIGESTGRHRAPRVVLLPATDLAAVAGVA